MPGRVDDSGGGFTPETSCADTSDVELLLDAVLALSFFGIPGFVCGWLAGRLEGYAPALLAVLLAGTGVAIVVLGRSVWSSDPFGAWAILILLALAVLNGCTAIGGVALARHSRLRDAHLAD
jgi:hypothetical protein